MTFPCNFPFQISNDKSINRLLEHILEEDNPENKYSRKTIELLIRLLMIKVGEEWESLQQKHETLPHYEELLNIRNQITSSPYKNWKVDELAEQAHLSYAYFQVLYKKAFGISCINDVINTKVAHAKELLISTNLPVNQIAIELAIMMYIILLDSLKEYRIDSWCFSKKIHINLAGHSKTRATESHFPSVALL